MARDGGPSGERPAAARATARFSRASLPPTTGAWREGDPVGDRRFVSIATDRAFRSRAAACCGHVTLAFETWGELDGRRVERRARVPRAHRRFARGRAQSVTGTRRRAGGTTSSEPGRCARHRSVLRRVRQRARRLPGHDRPGVDSIPRPGARTGRASRSSRSATWCGRRPPSPTTSASGAGTASSVARWAGCRCSSGG